jgi:hypothetical protein
MSQNSPLRRDDGSDPTHGQGKNKCEEKYSNDSGHVKTDSHSAVAKMVMRY